MKKNLFWKMAAVALAVLSIVTACRDINIDFEETTNLTNPTSPANPQDGYGTVRISFGGGSIARTLLPSEIDISKLYYVLNFTQQDGSGNITKTHKGAEQLSVQLAGGIWDLVIKGYNSESDAANPSKALVSYAKNDIVVQYGGSVTIDAKLETNKGNLTENGSGTLSYDITFPTWAALGQVTKVLKIYTYPANIPVGHPVDLSATGNQGSLELTSGSYNIFVTFEHQGLVQIWSEIVHINDNAITEAVVDPNDFTDYLSSFGNVDISLSIDKFTMTDEGAGIFSNEESPIVLDRRTGDTRTLAAAGLVVFEWRVGDIVLGTRNSITLNAAVFPMGTYTLDLVFLKNGKYWLGSIRFDVIDEHGGQPPEQPQSVGVAGVSLDKWTIELGEGEVSTLTETVYPYNATNKNVYWSSSNYNVEVSSNGMIKGNNVGTARITVTTDDGGFTAYCDVTVNRPSNEYTGEGPYYGEPIDIDDSGGIEIPGQGSGNVILLKDDDLTLFVTIDGYDDPAVSYQWYRAVSDGSYVGGIKIAGANRSTFEPPTNVAGTFYYFVEITFMSGRKQVSYIKTVTIIQFYGGGESLPISANQPRITQQPASSAWYAQYTLQGNVAPLVVMANNLSIATGESDGGVLSYQWYRNYRPSNSGGTLIWGANGTSYTPLTSMAGTTYYYVVITNTIPDNCDGGLKVKNVTSHVAEVEIRRAISAEVPTFKNNPALAGGGTYMQHATVQLMVEVNPVSDGGALTYQWYKVNSNSNEDGMAINNANGNVPSDGIVTYTADTSSSPDVSYYYCKITNTLFYPPAGTVFAQGGQSSSAKSNTALVSVGVTVSTIAYDSTGVRGIYVVSRSYNGDGPVNVGDPDISLDVEIRGNLGVAFVLNNGNGIKWGNADVNVEGWTRTEADYITPSTIVNKLDANYWRGTAKGRIRRSDVGTWEVEIVGVYLSGMNSSAHILVMPNLTGTITRAQGSAVTTPVVDEVTDSSITVTPVNLSNQNPWQRAQQTVVEYAINRNSNANVSTLTWQSSPTFTGLQSATTYYVYARSRQSQNFQSGSAAVSDAIQTADTE